MKIIIVDDDKLVGISLKTIIEAESDMEVIGLGLSGLDAISLYGELSPDILLMDIRMDKMTGLEAGEKILKIHPEAKILFLTTFADDEYIIKAIKIGAKGYILKQNFEIIAPSLRAVYAGQSVFGDDIVAKMPHLLGASSVPDFSGCGISDKETEIIELIAQGLSNKEIAGTLFLSEGTIRNSISVILEKLDLKGRTQLAVFYYKHKS
jgi:DNA-binding NarL/FixJ family response regulator